MINSAGRIDDIDRVMYLRNHLTHLHRAVSEGYPVKGYFLWSLMDNFEWADGYSKRFGIHYVDFKTLKRTPEAERGVVRRCDCEEYGGVARKRTQRPQGPAVHE